MRRINLFFWLLPSIMIAYLSESKVNKNSVFVCYGKIKTDLIKGYSYVILEEKHYNKEEIRLLKKQNKHVVAYISLGEVNSHASHFNLLKDNTLGKNNNWNSHYLDLSKDKTIIVLSRLIKKCLDKGFDGMFLDNIDNFTSFGPQKNQKKELLSLLKKIRQANPEAFFIQNAGFELINDTSLYVNAILFESVFTNYQFSTKKYQLREQKESEVYINKIKTVTEKYNIPILLVEYADNLELYKNVQQKINNLNVSYFIGSIDLQGIPSFSKSKK